MGEKYQRVEVVVKLVRDRRALTEKDSAGQGGLLR
jgi:hypothetical protein